MDSAKPIVEQPWQSTMWRLNSAPKRIYVAAPMTEQGTAARLSLQLIDAGFEVTSRWLRKDFSDRPSQDYFRKYAEYEATWGFADMEDVAAADTLIILAEQPSTHGGFHFELGYFLGLGKTNVVAVGNRPNVFFFTRHVRWIPTIKGLVGWLEDPAHGQPVACVVDTAIAPARGICWECRAPLPANFTVPADWPCRHGAAVLHASCQEAYKEKHQS